MAWLSGGLRINMYKYGKLIILLEMEAYGSFNGSLHDIFGPLPLHFGNCNNLPIMPRIYQFFDTVNLYISGS